MTPELIAAIVSCLLGVAGLTAAATAWLKAKTESERIRAERLSTKLERDSDSQAMHDSMLKLQFEVTSLKDTSVLHAEHIEDLNKQSATLNTTLAQVLTKLDSIVETLKELRERQ
jgi:uncharacterized coiled-coil DUF342 family protein